jgi:hypothetical protein
MLSLCSRRNLLTQKALGDAQTALGDKSSARAAYELALVAAQRLEADAQPLYVRSLKHKLRPGQRHTISREVFLYIEVDREVGLIAEPSLRSRMGPFRGFAGSPVS